MATHRVVVRVDGQQFVVHHGEQLTVGRGSANVIVLDHPKVSRRHAIVREEPTGWVFEDAGSVNGSFRDGVRVTRLPLTGKTSLSLGGPDGVELTVIIEEEEKRPGGRRPIIDRESLGRLSSIHQTQPDMTIGRGPENQLVLSDLQVSRHHARLDIGPGVFELIDLNSANGTFLNGKRIERELLGDGDIISIGSHLLRFTEGKLEEYVDSGQAWYEAAGLSVWTAERKQILDGIAFSLEPSSLLAVVGPSGSGKTTLLNALTGFRPAHQGSVLYGGRNLYDGFEDLRRRIGYVPQDDILHPQLTVKRALDYGARLRFPDDVSSEERKRRVEDVIVELGLSERANTRIELLSGGQRKRTSIALELLTRPALLFLDEPTSGLDPGNEDHVMRLLRSLADGGRIVVVVTHSVQSLDLCDRVLFLAGGGRTAYYGPPREALDYFTRHGVSGEYAQIFRRLDESRDVGWSSNFMEDIAYERYVRRPLERAEARRRSGDEPPPPLKQQGWWRQFAVLIRRYLAVIRADRRNLGLLLAQAPIFGLLFLFLMKRSVLTPGTGTEASVLMWLLVIGATWLGTSNAVREIVKESAIYRRERSVGLSPSAYVASKAVVLGVITGAQCVVLLVVTLLRQTLPPQDPDGVLTRLQDLGVPEIQPLPKSGGAALGSLSMELIIGIVLVGLAGMAIGLFISGLVRTPDRAASILPILLVAQVVLSMPFLPGRGRILETAGHAASATWGTAALGSSVSLNSLRAPQLIAIDISRGVLTGSDTSSGIESRIKGESQWRHESSVWTTNVVVLASMTGAFLVMAWLIVRRRGATPSPTGREAAVGG